MRVSRGPCALSAVVRALCRSFWQISGRMVVSTILGTVVGAGLVAVLLGGKARRAEDLVALAGRAGVVEVGRGVFGGLGGAVGGLSLARFTPVGSWLPAPPLEAPRGIVRRVSLRRYPSAYDADSAAKDKEGHSPHQHEQTRLRTPPF